VSPVYKPISNTFTVSAPGYYYVAVRATVANGAATNLSWDDLLIEIPCTPSLNTPTISLSVNNTTVCSGDNVTINAAGADVFNWNDGTTGPVLIDQPYNNTTYVVVATNTLTGCKKTASQTIVVKQTPQITAFAFPPAVCSGKQVNLQASGAATYNWSNGGFGSSIFDAPTANKMYQVSGTGTNNCIAYATVQVSVNPLPNVAASVNNPLACSGDAVSFNASGAVNYQWVSAAPALVLQGATPVIIVTQPTSFTVTGTDANGCTNVAMVAVSADACTGINEATLNNGIKVFPNPTNSDITVSVGNSDVNTISVTDVTGRVVAGNANISQSATFNMTHLSAGVYYVTVRSAQSTNVIKIIKQ